MSHYLSLGVLLCDASNTVETSSRVSWQDPIVYRALGDGDGLGP